ncbi:hypothetical protein LQ236_000470 [Nitrospina gracilis]|nr:MULTISPECIES: hypothetical protein [Nitrospina]MCF8722450.1 hypothetical protein [Nitrospina sp. Nb-3]
MYNPRRMGPASRTFVLLFLVFVGFGWGCATKPAVQKSVPEENHPLHALIEPVSAFSDKEGVLSTLPEKGYLLKPLAKDVYFFSNGTDCTLFAVTADGVVLVDPLFGSAELIKKAMREVTELPVTVIVYSNDSPRHIGDASRFGDKVTVIAQEVIALRLKQNNPAKVPLPHMSFTTDYRLATEFMTLELHHIGGEGNGDTLVLVPDLKVGLLPDRAIPNWVPHLEKGEPIERRVLVLERLNQMDFLAYVPGHGDRPGSHDDLKRTLKFYEDGYRAFRFAAMRVFGEDAWLGTSIRVEPERLREKEDLLARECYRLLAMHWGGRLKGFRELGPAHCRAWVAKHIPPAPPADTAGGPKTGPQP